MGYNIKQQILESIGEIYDSSKNCRLENSFFEKVDQELSILANYFNTTKIQAFFVAIIFTLNCKGHIVDFSNLIEYFDCNPMRILNYSDDLEILQSKGIINKIKSRRSLQLTGVNNQFMVNGQISEAILQNRPIPKIQNDQPVDLPGILGKLYNLSEHRDSEMISTLELFVQAEEIISKNLHFPLIKSIDNLDLRITEKYLFLYLIWEALSGRETTGVTNAINEIFDNVSRRVSIVQDFLTGKSQLIKDNLIELVEGNFLNESEMRLTDKSIEMLKEFGFNFSIGKKKNKNIIEAYGIHPVQLVFNREEEQQLLLLRDLFTADKFTETQSRLKAKGMPKGVTVLFHGVPGTGKTETVKQLSRQTHRDIMKVDISQAKSKWFGESEKKIKRIFTSYKAFSEGCEQTPILLFNEADAIFSRRMELGNSSVEQTENAIQNIILEELENFDGILIATTNLIRNFDPAFERRFLFKIEFRKPDMKAKKEIWKNKLPHLTDSDRVKLAAQFDFSGGQIDNVVRKKEMNEIIYGHKVSFENIHSFCREESWSTKRVRIGFSKS